jgi:hypothetical protein
MTQLSALLPICPSLILPTSLCRPPFSTTATTPPPHLQFLEELNEPWGPSKLAQARVLPYISSISSPFFEMPSLPLSKCRSWVPSKLALPLTRIPLKVFGAPLRYVLVRVSLPSQAESWNPSELDQARVPITRCARAGMLGLLCRGLREGRESFC